jgi:ADP-ribose pyrophosphatase YjhB (NUDIX family)
VREEDIALSDGTQLNNYILTEEQDVGMVFALTREHEVVLVREFKVGVSCYVWDLPSGGLEIDESPLDGTKRELVEETGYSSHTWYPLGNMVVMPSRSRSRLYSFLTLDATRLTQPKDDPKEKVETQLLRLEDLLPMIRSGELNSLESVVTILMALDKLRNLGI